MKRVFYSWIIIIFTLLFGANLKAQMTASVSPNNQCYSASAGGYTMNAGIFAPVNTATHYTWTIISPGPTSCAATFTPGQHGALSPAQNGSQIAVTFPCCGSYTLTVFAFNNTITPGTPIGVGPPSQTISTIYCPTSGSVSVSNTAICIGNQVLFTGTGGATALSYTWNTVPQFVGNPVVLSPTINTCLTYTATTAQGCTVSPPPGCMSVQAISATVSPANQTICVGSPICLTATAQAISNSSVLPGTATTAVNWFAPGNVPIATSCTTAATAGVYSAVFTHTGVAGTCNYTATANVATSNSISVVASASAPSVCPGATVQLSATSVQTAAASYTWFSLPSPPATFSVNGANPVITTNSPPNINTPITYSVAVDYFGCPGGTVVSVGMLTLTPTLTPSSFSICPNTALTLTASGGSLYTFRYAGGSSTQPPGGSFFIFGTPNSATNIRTHTPNFFPTVFPQWYSVSTSSNGCTGSTTIQIGRRTLNPTLTPSSASVCPGTQFTLTTTGVGGGAVYTYSSNYSANLGSTIYTVAHTPPSTNPVPQVYTVKADSSTCTGSATATVNLLTLQPTLTPSAYSICPGTAMSLTVSGGQDTRDTLIAPWTTPASSVIAFGMAGPSNFVFNFTPVIPPSLPHTYTVHVDSAGCKGSQTITIGLLNLGPQILITPSSASVCANTQLTLNANTPSGPNSFNYTFIAPVNNVLSLLTPTSAVHTPPTLPQTYTVFADSSSCVGTATITIYEKTLNPILTAYSTSICAGMTDTIKATNVGYGPMVSYQFGILVPSPPMPLPGGGPTFSYVTHNPIVQTVYSVFVDSAGCKSNTLTPPTITVNIRPVLSLTPSATSASVCPGTAATLAVVGPTYVAWPITFTWTQSAGTGSFVGTPPLVSPSVTAFPFTNSTYSVNAMDSLGCIGSTIISVGVDPTISFPVVLASTGTTICPQQTVGLSANYTVNTAGGLTYTWTPGTGSLSSMNIQSVVVSPPSTQIYTLTMSNQYGCVSGNTIDVPVGTVPVISTVATAPAVCTGFTSTITAFGANTYSWTGSTFTNVIAQQSIAVGPGQYTVLGSNGGGCTAQVSPVNIFTLAPIPVVVTASSPTTCIESNFPRFSKPVKLSASGAGTYVWFPYNPNNMTFSLGPTTDVRPGATTVYTVIGSTSVCANSATVMVTVIPQFTMNVVPPLPAMCLGDSIKLSIINIDMTKAVGPVSAFTYSWTEPLNAPPISLSNNLTPTVMAFPQNTSTYSVEVRDSRKCISMPRLVTVTVLPRPMTSIAIPTINSVPTNSLCYVGLNPGPKDVTIDLLGVNGNTNLQFGVVPTYTWLSPYGTKYNSILTPSNQPGITVNAPVKAPSVVTYTLISGYNGIAGCKRMDTVNVRVIDCRPIRDVKFTTTEVNDTICTRSCITFQNLTDTMAGGPQKVLWQFDGGSPSTSTLTIPTVCYNLPGKRNVILTVSNPYPIASGGSTLTIGQLGFVKVVDVPNVTIIAPGQSRSDTTIRFGTPVHLTGSGALSYEWSPNYNISSMTNPKVTVNPFKTTQYILTGYNSKKCQSSDTLNVIVIEDCGEMYVPNAFSPNNDGHNDVLYVRGICLESLTFMIFNRWGEKVFETNDQKVGWDGTYKGEEMNTGVFVYRLEGKTYEGKGFSLKGNITLIR